MSEIEKIKLAIDILTEAVPNGVGAPNVAELLADLPAEAVAGPKTDASGNPLRTWDAELTGYLPAYVWKAAVERLGAGGWSEIPIWDEPRSIYLSRRAQEAGVPDGVEVDVTLVVWFPSLRAIRVTAGTGKGTNIGDAKKAAKTSALKRALAEVGIGWRGYTDTLRSDDEPAAPAPASAPAPAPAPAIAPEVHTPKPAPKPAAKAVNPATASDPATGAQKSYLKRLLEEAQNPPEVDIEALTKSQASELIKRLKGEQP